MNNPIHNLRRPQWRQPVKPALVFSPLAWLKLMFFLHAGDTEVGGFGVSAGDNLLYVQDFVTVKQLTSCVSVEFHDEAVADYFDACVNAGLPPSRFARIWCHTHPGSSSDPSVTDEQTFARVFGSCDWSVMFIVSRTGSMYARLSFSAGPGVNVLLPISVDWADWPKALAETTPQISELLAHWEAEYLRNIQTVDINALEGLDEWGYDRDAPLNPDDPFGVWPSIASRSTDERFDESADTAIENRMEVDTCTQA